MPGPERLLFHPPTGRGPLAGRCLVLWHGAGGDVDQVHLVAVADAVAAAGGHGVRARFGYRMAGRRAPERMPALMAHARETLAEVRAKLGEASLFLGGRSMGGRVASMLAADGEPTAGLVFLAYPLHPAKQESKLRDAHLYGLEVPMLFLQGTKDALARQAILQPVLDRLGPRATCVWYEGADHSQTRVAPERVAADVVGWLTSRS
ncbi:MAG: dienelactone hydrolase family protein [Myxococcales bacterium]|nr:dienelactone hydrolase family protein [Myxococcales bacterium]